MIGVRTDNCCRVDSTILAIQPPKIGVAPIRLRINTNIVEIIAKPIVAPNAQPTPE